MPVETIKCQECGSADVMEFKFGSYVCTHCEAIFKYVDPAGGSSCSCGTFAVGRCAECHTPVCAQHGGMFDGRRLCEAHLRTAQAADAARRAQAHADSTAETLANRIRAWDDWLDAAQRALADSHDAIERLVRVVAALQAEARAHLPGENWDIVAPLLLPDVLDDRGMVRWWWDNDAVQAWFLHSVKAPPERLEVVRFRKTLFGGRKREDATGLGWSFPQGGDVSKGDYSTFHWESVSVLTDGRRLWGANADDGPRIGFNESTLVRMVELAELAPLPPRPSMSFNHPRTGERIWPTA